MKNMDRSKDTGLALVLILLLTTLVTANNLYLVCSIIVLVLVMTLPVIFSPLSGPWFGLSHVLGLVVSKIVLAGVFFLVVTPVGLARRLAGKDAMGLKNWKAGRGSVFIERNHLFISDDLDKPF
ncbi:MAG: hypothetical protein KKB30_14100 [Proteobacteria bacterium]|nr:hypothetical protein [Pseudomonadota bacterium]MBU1715983.1 hypothetical protein [Pseudomonadota bacterium]